MEPVGVTENKEVNKNSELLRNYQESIRGILTQPPCLLPLPDGYKNIAHNLPVPLHHGQDIRFPAHPPPMSHHAPEGVNNVSQTRGPEATASDAHHSRDKLQPQDSIGQEENHSSEGS